MKKRIHYFSLDQEMSVPAHRHSRLLNRSYPRWRLVAAVATLAISLLSAIAVGTRSPDAGCPVLSLRYEPMNGGAFVAHVCAILALPPGVLIVRYSLELHLTLVSAVGWDAR